MSKFRIFNFNKWSNINFYMVDKKYDPQLID